MKRWMIIVLWFVVLVSWNFVTRTAAHSETNFVTSLVIRSVESVEFLLSPIEIIASVAVVVYVWKKGWQGKSLAGNK